MRLLMLAPALALTLAACGKSDESQGNGGLEAITPEAISSNDVTAIDAVTGEAANMAADVELTLELNNTADGAVANDAAPRPRPPARSSANRPAERPPAPAAEPAEVPAEPQSNATE